MNLQTSNRCSYFFWVAVESANKMEALLLETSITAEGSAKVPDSNKDDIPSSIGSEDSLDAFDKLCDFVSDASLADGSQAGDIAANLGVIESESFGDRFALNILQTRAVHLLQFPKVKRQPGDGGFRDLLARFGHRSPEVLSSVRLGGTILGRSV